MDELVLVAALAVVVGLFLLVRYPKPTLMFVAVSGVCFGGFMLYKYTERQKKEEAIKAVTVDVSYTFSKCSGDRPLLVTVKNNSNKVVNGVTWGYGAKIPGYSDDVTDSTLLYFIRHDKILQPKEGFRECFEAPPLSAKGKKHGSFFLNWYISNKNVDFKR